MATDGVMLGRLAGRLSAARHRGFIGRTAERALFAAALAAAEPPFQVLYVVGPGGVGKTALLEEFRQLCDDAQVPTVFLDARQIEPTPSAFLDALRGALGPGEHAAPLAALAAYPRVVLFLDTCETLVPLEGWLHESFLPQVPERALVVLASRTPPPLTWRSDAGWQRVGRVLALRNLSPEESRVYLESRGVPPAQHGPVLQFTHGHPLALSLVAELFRQRPGTRFQPEATPDVVKALLEQLVQKVPGPAHRAALEACALVRIMTEGLLAAMLNLPDAHELFEWLRGLSFMESERQGLRPHDTTREVLAADLRWRNPDWYAELHRRARAYYEARLHQSQGQEQQRILLDFVYLHRDNLVVRPYYDWSTAGQVLADAPRADDWPALLDMVAAHEGPASAALARHWLQRQPEGVLVVRDPDEMVAGFMASVALERASPEDRALDPAVAAAWRYLEAHAPLRGGERATLFRFWMARDTYQGISPAQSLIATMMVRHYLSTPGLAFTFLPCADPGFWALLAAYVDFARIPEADFTVGGRTYGVYGHDWRVNPATTWLEVMAEREIAAGQDVLPQPAGEVLVVLSQVEFDAAVRDALRNLTQPDGLRANPLLRSRLVVEKAGREAPVADRIATLQRLLREAIEELRASPKQAKLYRALHHTYVQPAATQERAAEILDLPFSTYRRHLTSGAARVAESLWRAETLGLGAS